MSEHGQWAAKAWSCSSPEPACGPTPEMWGFGETQCLELNPCTELYAGKERVACYFLRLESCQPRDA